MGKWALAQMLLDFGADPNIPDNDGYTALDEVQHDPEMVQLLLKYGAIRGRKP
jgi:ankyrin repeat protein